MDKIPGEKEGGSKNLFFKLDRESKIGVSGFGKKKEGSIIL